MSTENDIKILPPFKMQVLTNFPYIEADFDAITNYQLLCKVVEYLNNTINSQNEVVAGFNYVLNYFNNLDVQEEIDNKLDEMAEDGSLTNLIAGYLNPYIQAQNNAIQEFKNDVNSTVANQNTAINTIDNNTQTAINTQNGTINTLSARVTELSTLTEGSTTGDAELADIRIGFNGVTYSNAGDAVRGQCGDNNDLIHGLIDGSLFNTQAIDLDKLKVDTNFTQSIYNYHQNANASTSSGYITYVHDTNATKITLKGKLIIKSNMDTLKIHTRISGNNYFFYTFTNLKAGDIIYLYKKIEVPTSADTTIRLLLTVQNTTTEREMELINPVFLQDGIAQESGTYGYESGTAGTCTYSTEVYKALATKEYVDNAISGSTLFNSLNFGCCGDSITTERNGATNWPTYVNSELGFASSNNTAVGSSTYAFKKLTYNNVEYTPQDYSQIGWAGYSTATTPSSTEQAQQIANNCAKNHVEEYIANVTAGTYPTPDIFIFAYGTNDNPTDGKIGSVADAFSDTLANIDKYTMAGGMRYAIERITTAYPNCQCFVLNILQSAYGGYQSRDNQIKKNNLIKEIADYFSIPVINQYDESGISRLYESAGANGRYLSDGLHPNTAGKKKEASYITEMLKTKYCPEIE